MTYLEHRTYLILPNILLNKKIKIKDYIIEFDKYIGLYYILSLLDDDIKDFEELGIKIIHPYIKNLESSIGYIEDIDLNNYIQLGIHKEYGFPFLIDKKDKDRIFRLHSSIRHSYLLLYNKLEQYIEVGNEYIIIKELNPNLAILKALESKNIELVKNRNFLIDFKTNESIIIFKNSREICYVRNLQDEFYINKNKLVKLKKRFNNIEEERNYKKDIEYIIQSKDDFIDFIEQNNIWKITSRDKKLLKDIGNFCHDILQLDFIDIQDDILFINDNLVKDIVEKKIKDFKFTDLQLEIKFIINNSLFDLLYIIIEIHHDKIKLSLVPKDSSEILNNINIIYFGLYSSLSLNNIYFIMRKLGNCKDLEEIKEINYLLAQFDGKINLSKLNMDYIKKTLISLFENKNEKVSIEIYNEKERKILIHSKLNTQEFTQILKNNIRNYYFILYNTKIDSSSKKKEIIYDFIYLFTIVDQFNDGIRIN